jgi:predicted nucleic acid-binding protein
MIAVDSSVWIDVIRGRDSLRVRSLRAWENSGEVIALTDVVYMELLRGAPSTADLEEPRRLALQAPILRMTQLSDFEHAADLYRRARAAGLTVRNVSDCMIAAVCIREGVPLLHDDADFDRLADVSALQLA